MRGIDLEWYIDFWEKRITPACAGNSLLKEQKKYMGKDHPRVCGE